MPLLNTTLVVNPTSGRGAAARTAGSVADELRCADPRLRAFVAPDAAGTRRVVEEAVARGDDVVAVLGGDGTVHVAVQALAGTGTALAVIPSGSGNDLAAALGLPPTPVAAARHAAAVLRRGERRRIDLGRVDGGDWFTTVLCTGFDAAVSARANALRWPTGPRRYEVAVLAELARLTSRPVTVDADGAGTLALDTLLVAVGNTPSYGGGLRICPGAEPDDGQLDVTVIGAATRRRLLRVFPSLRSGGHLDAPEVHTLRDGAVTLAGPASWAVYADGEPLGTLPVTVRAVPGALTVVA